MDTFQAAKTRWSHYQIAYHFVWIPKYRRKILTGEVETVVKQAIADCCLTHGFTLLALETDIDHVHCFISAPPKDAPAKNNSGLALTIAALRDRLAPKPFVDTLPNAKENNVKTAAFHPPPEGKGNSRRLL